MHYPAQRGKTAWYMWPVLILLIVGLVVPIWLMVHTTWGAATLSYEWTATQLVITFGPSKTRIDRDDITAIHRIDKPTKGRRHVGTNLPTLKEGRWSFAETGNITLYSTSLQPLTVVETANRKWGVSPADADAFAAAWREGELGDFVPVAGGVGAGLWVFVGLMSAMTAGMVWLFVYVRRLERHLGYELTVDAVVVHGGRKPITIPYEKITDVRIESPSGTPWRSMGVQYPGLYWGAFSWQAVKGQLRLYASSLRPIVFVAGGLYTYGLSPEDAEGFVAELKQRLADGKA